jgi:hypothetical protein
MVRVEGRMRLAGRSFKLRRVWTIISPERWEITTLRYVVAEGTPQLY